MSLVNQRLTINKTETLMKRLILVSRELKDREVKLDYQSKKLDDLRKALDDREKRIKYAELRIRKLIRDNELEDKEDYVLRGK